jgi:hypothetical protein
MWNSVKAKASHQAWRKLRPTIMFIEGTSDQEDFTGFNVHNKDTVHKMVLICKKLDPSSPERELSQADVEEWTDEDCSIMYHS